MTHDSKRTDTKRGDTLAGSTPGMAGGFTKDEETFWRGSYEREPYFQKDMTWDDYEPAYRFGYDWHERHRGRRFEDVESDMASGWEKVKAKSRLKWEHAKAAARAAWDRMEHAVRDRTHEHSAHR